MNSAPELIENMKEGARIALIFGAIALGLVIARSALIANAPQIKLQGAPALTGVISQSLATSSTDSLPISGRDYRIGEITYFSGQTWLVVPLIPVSNSANSGYVIMHKTTDGYSVVLGPGSIFASDTTSGMPQDLVAYLKDQGLFYEPVNE